MNHNSPAFMTAMVLGALVAGALCGLLPLSIGLARKRIDLAVGSMIACILCGLVLGLLLALPAAVICTTAIYAFTPRPKELAPAEEQNYRSRHRGFSEPTDAHLDRALQESPSAKPRIKNISGHVVRCASCGREYFPGMGPTPPWCRGCGADLRTADAAPAKESDAKESKATVSESTTANPAG